MATAIHFDTVSSVQLLSVYRGAGKPTDLLRLRQELGPETYVPDYFDVLD